MEQLYRRYGHFIERRCQRILDGNAADARDAAQETFARAIAKRGQFRGDNEQLAWLYRISSNVCFNVLRGRRARGDAWQRSLKHSLLAVRSDDEQRAHERQCVRRLITDERDELTRELLFCVYFDDMSQGEAAAHLGISRTTANARLGRFCADARRRLEEEAL